MTLLGIWGFSHFEISGLQTRHVDSLNDLPSIIGSSLSFCSQPQVFESHIQGESSRHAWGERDHSRATAGEGGSG